MSAVRAVFVVGAVWAVTIAAVGPSLGPIWTRLVFAVPVSVACILAVTLPRQPYLLTASAMLCVFALAQVVRVLFVPGYDAATIVLASTTYATVATMAAATGIAVAVLAPLQRSTIVTYPIGGPSGADDER